MVGALIGIIYYPTTVSIRCEQSTSNLELSRDEVVAIVTDPEFMTFVADVSPDLVPMAEVAVANAKALQ